MGRWLVEHLFSRMDLDRLVLVDRNIESPGFVALADERTRVTTLDGVAGDVDLGATNSAVCFAVPRTDVSAVAERILPLMADDAVAFDISSAMRTALDDMAAAARPGQTVFGTHPLFSPLVRTLDGQTIVVAPPDGDDPGALTWFVDAVGAAGGIVKTVDPGRHDEVMAYVETMAQQTLLGFADAVTQSGLDLERELWESRTPLFETLLGLATNVLAESQQTHIASRQSGEDTTRVQAALAAAMAIDRSSDPDAHIESVRDRFSGSLFDTIQATAIAAIAAGQSKKADLSRHARTGELVGLVPTERNDTLRVGRIAELSPTSVTLIETMVGAPGDAAMLEGPGAANATRLGKGGKPSRTTFGLGRIDVSWGADLDDRLDDWLAHVRRDVRFLVPESVAGSGVLSVVAEHRRVRNCEVVSEVVRTGQRAVVIRLEVRCDSDIDDMVELLRSRVGEAYAWPQGLSLPVDAETAPVVTFLGPVGTFSESAALQALTHLGVETTAARPVESFDEVIVAADAGGLGVVPVASSASGLVERTAAALLDAPPAVTASGVVDVAVRFDAFVPAGMTLSDLRGATVVSHPQALEQCARFIERWKLTPEPCQSTADACRIAARDGDKVAISRADLDHPAELRVAEREIDDIAGALTRFLVIGRDGQFGALVGGSDPTLRSLWIAAGMADLAAVLDGTGPAFDEIITSPTGRVLLVTSRDAAVDATATLRFLGRVPWTPRTPLVRLGGAIKGLEHGR